MSNLAGKLPEKTRVRLLSKPRECPEENLPPHMSKAAREKLTPDKDENYTSLKMPFYYASMIAMFIFVYFSMY